MSPGCESSGSMEFRVVDNEVMEQLRGMSREAVESKAEAGTRDFPVKADLVEKTFIVGNRMLPAAGTRDGKAGCVTIPVFGVPIKVCWRFEDFQFDFPSASMNIMLTAGVGSSEYLTVTLHISCENVLEPEGCKIEIGDHGKSLFDPKCDWGCFRSCAPGCITCGTNYWCWAGCAISCVGKCCHF